MPCACQVPVPQYPDTADWGPIMWTLFHGLAERAGRASLPADEVREWQRLLKLTAEVLPCDKCRAHFAAFLKANPATALSTIPYNHVKIWIRSWFFSLHNEINVANGKEEFPFDQLAATYESVNFQDLFWRLEPVMKKAIQQNGLSLMKWQTWIHSYKMLKSILAI